jgi:hypothetical protein
MNAERKRLNEICEQLQPLAEFAKDESVCLAARRMLDAKEPERGLTLGEQAIRDSGGIPG